jgi:hypothetical protein
MNKGATIGFLKTEVDLLSDVLCPHVFTFKLVACGSERFRSTPNTVKTKLPIKRNPDILRTLSCS